MNKPITGYYALTGRGIVGSDPTAVAKLTIMSAANDAAYATTRRPKQADLDFWDRVGKEAERIAGWVVSTFGIVGRGVRHMEHEPQQADVDHVRLAMQQATDKWIQQGKEPSGPDYLTHMAEVAVSSLSLADYLEWKIETVLETVNGNKWRELPRTDPDWKSAQPCLNKEVERHGAENVRLVIKRCTIVPAQSEPPLATDQ